LEREAAGKAAGLRTHMLVALGAALTLVVAYRMGMPEADQSRVIQGLVTGVGFLGGGAILKITDERRIRGLTTAAGIWMTASIGIAVGAGKLATATMATVLTFVVLRMLQLVETRYFPQPNEDA
jgi:putative Mg2+ transporter-C (MgtC) family protein